MQFPIMIYVALAVTQFRAPDALDKSFAAVDSVAAGFRALGAASEDPEVPLASSPPRAVAELRTAGLAASGGTVEANETAGAQAASNGIASANAPLNLDLDPRRNSLPGETGFVDEVLETAREVQWRPYLDAFKRTLRRAAARMTGQNESEADRVARAEALEIQKQHALATRNATAHVTAEHAEATATMTTTASAASAPMGFRAFSRRRPISLLQQGQPAGGQPDGWAGIQPLHMEKHHVSPWIPFSIVMFIFGSYAIWRQTCGPKEDNQ
jgi:hypothetical protein